MAKTIFPHLIYYPRLSPDFDKANWIRISDYSGADHHANALNPAMGQGYQITQAYVPTDPDIFLKSSQYTISVMIYCIASPIGDEQYIFSLGDGNREDVLLKLVNGTLEANFYGFEYKHPTACSPKRWQHVLWVIDKAAEYQTIYLDGKEGPKERFNKAFEHWDNVGGFIGKSLLAAYDAQSGEYNHKPFQGMLTAFRLLNEIPNQGQLIELGIIDKPGPLVRIEADAIHQKIWNRGNCGDPHTPIPFKGKVTQLADRNYTDGSYTVSIPRADLNSFTLSFWCNATLSVNPSGNVLILTAKGKDILSVSGISQDRTDWYYFYQLTAIDGSKTQIKTVPSYIADSQRDGWHHFALVRKAGMLQVWFDGVPLGNAVSFGGELDSSSQLALEVGGNRRGLLSDLRLYAYALNDTEVEAMIHDQTERFGELTYYKDPFRNTPNSTAKKVNILSLQKLSKDGLSVPTFSLSAIVYPQKDKAAASGVLLSGIPKIQLVGGVISFFANNITYSVSLIDKVWAHILVSYEHTTRQLNFYINGRLHKLIVIDQVISSTKYALNSFSPKSSAPVDSSSYYASNIAEWRLFDQALTATQADLIAQHDLHRLRLALFVDDQGNIKTSLPTPTTVNLYGTAGTPFNYLNLPKKPMQLPAVNLGGTELTFMTWIKGGTFYDLFTYGKYHDKGSTPAFKAGGMASDGSGVPEYQIQPIRYGTVPLIITTELLMDYLDSNSYGKLDDGKWHHLAFTLHYKMGGIEYDYHTYLDGKLCGKFNDSGFNPQFSIPAWVEPPTIGGPNAKAAITNLRLFNRVLNKDQINGYIDRDRQELTELSKAFEETPYNIYMSGIPDRHFIDIGGGRWSPIFQRNYQLKAKKLIYEKTVTDLLPIKTKALVTTNFLYNSDSDHLNIPKYFIPPAPGAFCMTFSFAKDEIITMSYGGNYSEYTGQLNSAYAKADIYGVMILQHSPDGKKVNLKIKDLTDGTILTSNDFIFRTSKTDFISIDLPCKGLDNVRGFVIDNYTFNEHPFYNEPGSFLAYADKNKEYGVLGVSPIPIKSISPLHINQDRPDVQKWNIQLDFADGHMYTPYLQQPRSKKVSATNHHYRLEFAEGVLIDGTAVKILNNYWWLATEVTNNSITTIYLLCNNANFDFAPIRLSLQGTKPYIYPGPRTANLTLKAGPLLQLDVHGNYKPLKEIAGSFFDTLSSATFNIVDDRSEVISSPLKFRMTNRFEEANTLAISQDTEDQEVKIILTNSLNETITFKKLKKPRGLKTDVPQDLYNHFELKFRPGTLLVDPKGKEQFPKLEVVESNSGNTWMMTSDIIAGANQIQRLYFLCTADKLSLQAHSSLIFKLSGVITNPIGGSRMTQVDLELGYGIQKASNKEDVYGIDHVPTRIVDRLGQMHLPIYFAAVGAEQIKRNKMADLVFQIANQSPSQTFMLTSNYVATKEPSRFIITVAVQQKGETVDWALFKDPAVDKKNILGGFKASPLFKAAKAVRAAHLVQYTLEVKQNQVVNPFDTIEVTLEDIFTTMRVGYALVHLSWENVPNYWDGHASCRVERN